MKTAKPSGEPRAEQSGVRLKRATLEALIMAQAEIARHLDLDALSKAVVDTVQGLVGARHATFGLVDRGFIIYKALAGPEVAPIRLPVDGQSLSALAIRKGQLLRSDDTRVDPRVDQAACRLIGARSMVAAPLTVNGVSAGVLNAFAASVTAFTPTRMRVLEVIVPFVGDALSRALRFQAHG